MDQTVTSSTSRSISRWLPTVLVLVGLVLIGVRVDHNRELVRDEIRATFTKQSEERGAFARSDGPRRLRDLEIEVFGESREPKNTGTTP